MGHQGDQHRGISPSETCAIPPWLYAQWDSGQLMVLGECLHWGKVPVGKLFITMINSADNGGT